jgi:hypothetical protein
VPVVVPLNVGKTQLSVVVDDLYFGLERDGRSERVCVCGLFEKRVRPVLGGRAGRARAWSGMGGAAMTEVA